MRCVALPPVDPATRLPDLALNGPHTFKIARGVPLSTYAPIPADVAARSASVANWITDQVVPGFSYKWPQPPASTSDERWMREIAKAYRVRQKYRGITSVGRW
ncbi:Hypothetical protein ERS075547_07337 [Mycobacteroides abscessus]|nr:Hypothetical protein ERS075547_07337 [Mycobacteroides abscessus]